MSSTIAKLVFNATNNTITTSSVGVDVSAVSGSITSVGNGWFRLSVTGTFANSYANTFTLFFNGNTNTGDSYIWGAQLEAGSFATSYIPTTTAQVTRNADQGSMTGTNFSSWFNASAGTFYVEADRFYNVGTFGVLNAQNSTGSEAIGFSYGSGNLAFSDDTGGVNQVTINIANSGLNTFYKSAGAYSNNDFAFTVSGVSPSLDTLGTVASSTGMALYIGDIRASFSKPLNGHIRTIRYYSQRLPNSTLQSLTA